MDVSGFYALLTATCFTLVGLWWNVVQNKKEWHTNRVQRELASGIYLSFLIPGLMSMVAQVGVDNRIIWQAAFAVAAILGIFHTSRINHLTKELAPGGLFHRNRWAYPVIYFCILVFAIFPGLASLLGLGGLQMEAILIAGLLLIGHGLTWEFLTNPNTE